ncbi:hypothetical protein GCM10028820_04230 [Tessaracoccus terricola]
MSSFGFESDHVVKAAAQDGNRHAQAELDRRENDQRRLHEGAQQPSVPSGVDFTAYLALVSPIIAVAVLVAVLAKGVQWLALESPLASLFPGPATSTPQYVLAAFTLLVILPVGLWLVGLWVYSTRARVASWLLLPLATALVPAILLMTQQTVSTGDPSRGVGVAALVLGPVLVAAYLALLVWQRTGPRGIVGLHRRAQRTGQRGDLVRFVELQQKLMNRGLRSLGWEDPRMLEEALALAEGYRLLGQHARAQHLVQHTFSHASALDPQRLQDLQLYAHELGF